MVVVHLGAVPLAVDSTVVRTSGVQTIAGVKTFSDGAIFNGAITGPNARPLFDSVVNYKPVL